MDHLDSPTAGIVSAQIPRHVTTLRIDAPDIAPDGAIGLGREFRSLMGHRAAREAAITAGHRALVRLVTTR